MTEGASFELHARDCRDMDTDLSVPDVLDIKNTEEGLLWLAKDAYEVVGGIGPTLEPDGIHHIYILINDKKGKLPAITGFVPFPSIAFDD